jgi:hypothetical protein
MSRKVLYSNGNSIYQVKMNPFQFCHFFCVSFPRMADDKMKVNYDAFWQYKSNNKTFSSQ